MISANFLRRQRILSNKKYQFHMDLPLLFCLIILCGVSLIILYSAKQDLVLIQRQAIRMGIAFTMLILFAQIPPRLFEDWSIPLFVVALIMLIYVLSFGYSSKGAQRWLNLGFIRFQPAEVMKIALPIAMAKFLNSKLLPPSLTTIFLASVMVFIPSILVALQPDLGTAILIASSGISVLFFSGMSWRFMISIAGLGIAMTPLLWYLMHDYQKQRVLTLIHPERDPLGSSYHIIQSKIAIGSGGLHGKGWLHGTQANLEFLPERSTDFIFAVFSEEFGLIGIIFLLCLYLAIIFRGLYMGAQAQNTFSRILAGSIIMTFFVYIFVNIGMVSGILPVVGVPLPLISYGGTSMVTLMISFGILMSIHTHKSILKK